jgi:hypothetical protein
MEDRKVERYLPKTRKQKPLYQAPMALLSKSENIRATLAIEIAFKRVEAAQEELTQATVALLKTVNNCPKVAREDFHKFYDAGGCSLVEYRIWLSKGGKTYSPVRKRKGLRLVANNPAQSVRTKPARGPKAAY